jgi:hypothetical protein
MYHPHTSTIQMEVAGFTETSVSFYQTPECNIPEDDNILQNQLILF